MRNIAISATLAAALMAGAAFAEDATSAGDAAPIMVVDTPTFLKVASGANAFEIESSKLAKEKAASDDIKMVADMIIADHTKAGEKLVAIAKGSGVEFQLAPRAPKQEKMLQQLRTASGKDFDMLYLDIQAQAHMEAVTLFRLYAGSGDNQAIVGFAKETLPALETHMAHVKEAIDRI